VAMDDVRTAVRAEHELQRRLREEGKARGVVVETVQLSAIEELVLGVRVDEETAPAVRAQVWHVDLPTAEHVTGADRGLDAPARAAPRRSLVVPVISVRSSLGLRVWNVSEIPSSRSAVSPKNLALI
jgi:hypothetical protein